MRDKDIVLLEATKLLIDTGLTLDEVAIKVTEDITTSSKYRYRNKIRTLYSEYLKVNNNKTESE